MDSERRQLVRNDNSQQATTSQLLEDKSTSNGSSPAAVPLVASQATAQQAAAADQGVTSASAERRNQEKVQGNNKGKITHRSQSSPSSLTTHKFGLRPTPSPPRLIIDHNTGDIVESYPEQPVYLRTYQPLDDDDCEDDSIRQQLGDDNTLSDSSAHPYPPPLTNRRQAEQYNQLLDEQYGSPHSTAGEDSAAEPLAVGNMNRSIYRPAIPPPHSAAGSNKVYFAPPEPSAGHHLFRPTMPVASDRHQQHQHPQQQAVNYQMAEPMGSVGGDQMGAGTIGAHSPTSRLSGSHNSSFKRALNKLNDATKTDIAIVTEPDDSSAAKARGASSGGRPGGDRGVTITATSAAKANALLAAQQKRGPTGQSKQQAGKSHQKNLHRKVPAIEDFNLYSWCYNFCLILVVLLSSAIIYLLVAPLHTDCTQYRPTYTYISIIVSSVNLICIVIFTLFWYCSGVTRTLYANLSSSAFIITTYSILVAVNLALAILFFFINTCHSQRLTSTGPALTAQLLAAANRPSTLQAQDESAAGLQEPYLSPPPLALPLDGLGSPEFVNHKLTRRYLQPAASEQHQPRHSIQVTVETGPSGGSTWLPRHRDPGTTTTTLSPAQTEEQTGPLQPHDEPHSTQRQGRQTLDETTSGHQQQQLYHNHHQHGAAEHSLDAMGLHEPPPGQAFASSPFEAAWEFIKEQLALFRRKFHHFLHYYDLRFVGALHALCAMWLMYLAMKVAVVRSFFCSPVGAYV